MKRLLLLTILCALGVVAAPAVAQAATLVGDTTVESTVVPNNNGVAHAVEFTASASGTATSISFYVDSGNLAANLYLGIYAVSSGTPGALLDSGSTSSITAGAWNTVNLSGGVALTSGTSYYLGWLGTGGSGSLFGRDNSGSCARYASNATNLTSLANPFGASTLKTPGCQSFYVSGTSAAPVNTVPPYISGTPQEGQVLTANNGTWTGDMPMTFTYQWQRDGVNLSGQTLQTHTANSNDVGHTLDVVVTATNDAGSANATSASVGPITSSPPVNTALPVISGTDQVGSTLTTTNGTWTGSPTSYSYQWQDCSGGTCSNISGATSSSYTLQSSDAGDTIDVVVTATNSGGSTPATSNPTGTIGAGNATTCPAPTRTVTYANPGDDLTAKASTLTAGNTLVLNDGTYSPNVDSGAHGAFYINGINGTASNPIIIEAATDGGATITGANDANEPVFELTNSSYVTICGFNVKDAPSGHQLFQLLGDLGGQTGDGVVTNITVERMTGTNATGGDVDCFKFGENNVSINAHVLFQDDAAQGPCRYGFANHDVNGVTDRRDWAHNMSVTGYPKAAPRAGFNSYGSQNVTLENDIANNKPMQVENDFFSSVWQTSADPTNFPNLNTHYYGDMFFNSCAGVTSTSNAGSGSVMKDTYISIPADSTCQADLGTFYHPEGMSWSDPTSLPASNVVINNSDTGANDPGGLVTFTDSVFVNNTTALGTGPAAHAYSDFYNNGSNGDTLSSTDKTADPGYNTTTYGTPGAYFFPAPNLLGQGQGGADIGAHLIDEYVNGVLTSTPLWPWPMESRIQSAFGFDVDASIWKTLP